MAMRLYSISIYIIIFICNFPVGLNNSKAQTKNSYYNDYSQPLIANYNNTNIFDSLKLGKLGLGRMAFDYAMLGFKSLKEKGLLGKEDVLSIIDFSLRSDKKRLFVIDLKNSKLLYYTYVAHGRNSGTERALFFSNEPESYKSSIGFYVTKGTYTGKHGYTLKLSGYEKGYNDNAEERAIVMHSAEYVSEALIKQQGYIGRSLGCPALAPAIYKEIIDKIKNKNCLFIYGNDGGYIQNSELLKQPIKKVKSKSLFY